MLNLCKTHWKNGCRPPLTYHQCHTQTPHTTSVTTTHTPTAGLPSIRLITWIEWFEKGTQYDINMKKWKLSCITTKKKKKLKNNIRCWFVSIFHHHDHFHFLEANKISKYFLWWYLIILSFLKANQKLRANRIVNKQKMLCINKCSNLQWNCSLNSFLIFSMGFNIMSALKISMNIKFHKQKLVRTSKASLVNY